MENKDAETQNLGVSGSVFQRFNSYCQNPHMSMT